MAIRLARPDPMSGLAEADTLAVTAIPRFYWLSVIFPVALALPALVGIYSVVSFLPVYLLLFPVAVSVAVFGHQLLKMSKQKKYHRLIIMELVMICGSGLVIFAGALIGDQAGIARFGSDRSLASVNFGSLVFIIAAAAIVSSAVFAFSNTLYLASGTVNRALNIAGKVAYWALWFLVAVMSFGAYVIIYSSHDPSTD